MLLMGGLQLTESEPDPVSDYNTETDVIGCTVEQTEYCSSTGSGSNDSDVLHQFNSVFFLIAFLRQF
jgi:hypothetical protein